MVEAFKSHNVRVMLGSAGCVGKKPSWSKDTNATARILNLNLSELRNIDLGIARQEHVAFADIFWPMLTASHEAQLRYGTNYAVAGKDGVHPGWAGHTVMAYAFLHAMGVDGDIGNYTVDLKAKKATVSAGHELLDFKDGILEIKSTRYPFCIGDGAIEKDDNIHSGTTLVPFNEDLNRLTFKVKASASNGLPGEMGGTKQGLFG